MSDVEPIRDLLGRYCLHLDLHEVDQWVALFTPEATYEVFGRTFTGHDEIRGIAQNAPRGLHLGGQPVIRVHGESATSRQNLLFVETATGIQRAAIYDDELLLTDRGWRFSRRRCRFLVSDGIAERPER